MAVAFRKATKGSAKLRLALIGPAGTGKTYTSLLLAHALGKRIAVVDTERGSASKYADLVDFDVLDLESFGPLAYVEAIRAAEAGGYDVLVIDSLSHAWVGKGGGLDMHDQAVDRQRGTKNTFIAWREVTRDHNAMIEAIVQSRLHIIATMRAKTEYVQEKDPQTGKNVVRKVGLAPVQRDGLEYEFDVVGDLDQDNTLVISKTRCPALSGAVLRKPGADLAATLVSWLGSGPAPTPRPAPPPAEKPNGKPAGPTDGPSLYRWLEQREAGLVREGTCKPGDLVKAVVACGRKAGRPEEIVRWSPPYTDVRPWVEAFEAAVAQPEEAPPEAEPEENDPQAIVSEAQVRDFTALLHRKGEIWERVRRKLKKAATYGPADLTRAEMAVAVNMLNELSDAEEVQA